MPSPLRVLLADDHEDILAVALIRTGSPRSRIAILSALDDHKSRQGAAAGADLFLVKGMVPREMVRVMTEAVLPTAAVAEA